MNFFGNLIKTMNFFHWETFFSQTFKWFRGSVSTSILTVIWVGTLLLGKQRGKGSSLQT